jgi:hypothetical protein
VRTAVRTNTVANNCKYVTDAMIIILLLLLLSKVKGKAIPVTGHGGP